jgi:hypothetical protein
VLIPALGVLATSLDALCQHIGDELDLVLSPNNLFVSQDQVVLADVGARGLTEVVESGYEGTRPRSDCTSACHPWCSIGP